FLLPALPPVIAVFILSALLHWAAWIAEAATTLRLARAKSTRLLFEGPAARVALLCCGVLAAGAALPGVGMGLGQGGVPVAGGGGGPARGGHRARPGRGVGGRRRGDGADHPDPGGRPHRLPGRAAHPVGVGDPARRRRGRRAGHPLLPRRDPDGLHRAGHDLDRVGRTEDLPAARGRRLTVSATAGSATTCGGGGAARARAPAASGPPGGPAGRRTRPGRRAGAGTAAAARRARRTWPPAPPRPR